VREDLLGQTLPITPTVLDYKAQAEADSMLNTPATYGIYIAGLVFQWLKKLGGLPKIAQMNRTKAAVLYEFLDQTEFYYSPVDKDDRSLMNVPFRLRNETLNDDFLKQAKARGMVELKGHRAVGGMRASIYNAMPIEGVKALVEFMREFQVKHG
jgi:phosphoserine aminotransferase